MGCALCGSECLASGLKSHEELSHSRESFQCQTCGATFDNSKWLRKHSRLNGHEILAIFRTTADQDHEDRAERNRASLSPEIRSRQEALEDRVTRVDVYTVRGEQIGVPSLGPPPYHDLSFPRCSLAEYAFTVLGAVGPQRGKQQKLAREPLPWAGRQHIFRSQMEPF